MTVEAVQTVEVAFSDRMLRVRLVSSGKPWYQTVNYTVTGVEWHNDISAFWFDMKNQCATWFSDVLEEIENEIDVRLQVTATTWTNVPDEVRRAFELATV